MWLDALSRRDQVWQQIAYLNLKEAGCSQKHISRTQLLGFWVGMLRIIDKAPNMTLPQNISNPLIQMWILSEVWTSEPPEGANLLKSLFLDEWGPKTGGGPICIFPEGHHFLAHTWRTRRSLPNLLTQDHAFPRAGAHLMHGWSRAIKDPGYFS